MRILFAGPTLHGLATPGYRLAGTDILCRAPAQQGDILRALLDGATAVGLVDGRYEDVATPWHKEILYALSHGVAVYGAASMGALRAAECAAFGMVPVGQVAARYLSGDLVDDAAVAQIHSPPEMGCVPLTEALVNVEATVDAALRSGTISRNDGAALRASANRLFFKDRTYPAIVRAAGFGVEDAATLVNSLEACRRDLKREDALVLIDVMQSSCTPSDIVNWDFRETTAWRRFVQTVEGSTEA